MAYQALYRKWRPKTFDDVVGQGHVVRTLKNEINSKKTAHAYLFCGTRGTGKTSCAKIFARAINCLHPVDGNPCNECEICKGELNGGILDITEIDAASNNGVDNIRQIRDEVMYSAVAAKYKIYIIDEVHMLSDGAFNALLKTLEEPPPHVVFILATTEAHELPATITSRCQRFDFKRILAKDIVTRLREICAAETIQADIDALELIAHLADGALRDALSILDQCVCALPDGITLSGVHEVLGIASDDALNEAVLAVAEHDSTKALMCIDSVVRGGRDLNNFIEMLIRRFRDILVLKVSSEKKGELFSYGEETTLTIKKQSVHFDMETVSYILNVLCEAQTKARYSKSFRIIYEMGLIKLCNRNMDTSNEALLQRIASLENMINSENFTVQRPPAAGTIVKKNSVDVELNQSKNVDVPPWETEEQDNIFDVREKSVSASSAESNHAAIDKMKADVQTYDFVENRNAEKNVDVKPKKREITQRNGSWADILGLLKKTNPPLYGALVCKKAKISDGYLYFIKDGYTKAIIQCMQEKFDEAVSAVLGEVMKIKYVKQSEFDVIIEDKAASDIEILRQRAETALSEATSEIESSNEITANDTDEMRKIDMGDFSDENAPPASKDDFSEDKPSQEIQREQSNIRNFSEITAYATKLVKNNSDNDDEQEEEDRSNKEYGFEEDEIYAKPKNTLRFDSGENSAEYNGEKDPLDELLSMNSNDIHLCE